MNKISEYDEEKKAKKALLTRVNKARLQRALMKHYIDECYEIGMLDDRFHIDETTRLSEREDYEDVFDTTFADELCDFATTQQDYFTPDYKPWVKITPNIETESDADAAELKDLLNEYEKKLYERINTTSYYEACEEAWKECAISMGGIAIPLGNSNRALSVLPIYMSELLVDVDSFNRIDGRWYDVRMKKEHIEAEFRPMLDVIMDKVAKFKSAKPDTEFTVTQGNHRDWSADSEVYFHDIIIDKKVISMKKQAPGVPPMVIPLRWGQAQKTAWAYGPAKRALPNARTLDELSYNNLVSLGYLTKFPITYENDGTQNYENGIEPGGAYPRARGSMAPQPILPQSKGNDEFDRERLEMRIAKAFYADGPEQKGKTPPTTTQWLDEKARYMRRQARRQVYREFVLTSLRRLAYVFGERNELDAIKLNDKTVMVQFLSPMAQSSDAEEVSAGMQLAGTAVSTFGETFLASVDAHDTVKNWKEKMGDTTIVLKQPDDQGELISKMLGEGRNIISDGVQ